MNLIRLNNSNIILNDFLMQIRDKETQKDRRLFKKNIERIGMILALEASRILDYTKKTFYTPFGVASSSCLAEQPILLSVLRAGIPMLNGVQEIFDQADCSFYCGVDTHSKRPQNEIMFLSDDIEKKSLIIIDPIIASGRTLINLIQNICRIAKPKRLIILSVIISDFAIVAFDSELECPLTVITCDVDKFTPGVSGMIPGIGDSGDLLYGNKKTYGTTIKLYMDAGVGK